MPADMAASILRTLKEERDDMIHAAVTYFDESAEDQSPEVFRAQLRDLEARWAAIASNDKDTRNKSAASPKTRKRGVSAREKS
jgi:hypothetical protein